MSEIIIHTGIEGYEQFRNTLNQSFQDELILGESQLRVDDSGIQRIDPVNPSQEWSSWTTQNHLREAAMNINEEQFRLASERRLMFENMRQENIPFAEVNWYNFRPSGTSNYISGIDPVNEFPNGVNQVEVTSPNGEGIHWEEVRRVEPIPYNPDHIVWENNIQSRGLQHFIDTYGVVRSEENIKEKKMSDNKNNLENLVTGNELQKPKEPIKISIKGLIEDINNGYTRLKGDTGYNEKIGSVEEKYGISKADVREIFKNSQLVNLRVKPVKEKAYELIDDVTVVEPNTSEPEKVIFGKASEATVKEIVKNIIEPTTENVDILF